MAVQINMEMNGEARKLKRSTAQGSSYLLLHQCNYHMSVHKL